MGGQLRVRMRRTHPEHISSALPPIADVREQWRHFAFVPLAAQCTAAKSTTIRSPRRPVPATFNPRVGLSDTVSRRDDGAQVFPRADAVIARDYSRAFQSFCIARRRGRATWAAP